MKSAYSYIRFSTPEQAKGDSFRRQSEKAADWAKEHGYRIVDEMHDLGVSAFRGKNTKQGRLGAFLAMIEAKLIEEGSVLIVESLDRFSRSQVREVLPDFLNVINAGIGVVTLADGRLFDIASLDKDNFSLLAGLIVMTRAHEESQRKSERVAAAWSDKRLQLRKSGLPLSDRIPGWLISERDAEGRRTFRLDEGEEGKANIVRRIFAETVQGRGRRAIVKGLNRDGKKSFLSEAGWQPSSVIKIIRARTTLGEYQPHKRDEKGRLIPDGDPVKNYYPPVVDEDLWVRANTAVTVRRRDGGGRPHSEVANLIRGLARCSCGSAMQFLNKGKPPKGGQYYVCSSAARNDGCENKRLWNAKNVERHVLQQIDPARVVAPFEPAEQRRGPSPQEFDLLIAERTAMRDAATDAALRNAGKRVAAVYEQRVETLNDEIENLQRRREDAAIEERSKPDLSATQSAIRTVAALAEKLDKASGEEKISLRTAIIQQLRTAYTEISFRPYAIVGLIELPEKPKPRKSGLPNPFVVRSPAAAKPRKMRNGQVVAIDSEKSRERYFLRHVFFRDDPEELAALGGGKGIVTPRYS
ncbi:recombinase family protein [Bradyrhizobium diazoefficiens]|uniref:recombinase family protein n=1 Tax=Bradyrhizobium diazoefficiens TaxID=1355477 RepID=UPI0027153A39|nr:recombinase family protein [Bradyrhizobium diazoefficiens]WLC16632.1 recombinase family protein [Bradyrhizobium diazoefficiens]